MLFFPLAFARYIRLSARLTRFSGEKPDTFCLVKTPNLKVTGQLWFLISSFKMAISLWLTVYAAA